jgi:hypothetical protein
MHNATSLTSTSEPEQYGELEMTPPKKHSRRSVQDNPKQLSRRKSSSRRRSEKKQQHEQQREYEVAPTLLDLTTNGSENMNMSSQYGAPPVSPSTLELMAPIAASKEETDDDESESNVQE